MENNENNEDGNSEDYVLPDGVIERLTQYADRVGKELKDVINEFLADIEKHHGCTDPSQEDEDLLIDWSEQFLTDTRNETTGSTLTGSIPYVGCFIGVAEKKTDRRANLVTRAKREFTLDPEQAVGGGFVGHYVKKDGAWYLNSKDGQGKVDVDVNEIPEHSFTADGQRICLLAKSGRPKAMSMMGRWYYFLGATEAEFSNEGAIQIWRLDMQGEDADAIVRIGEPCKVIGRANPDAKDGWKDVLATSMGTKDAIVYTDEFVNESLRSLLRPFKFWCDSELHPYYTNLEDLLEAFEAGSRTFNTSDGQGRAGPLVLTRGQVNRMSTEPRDNQYDDDNRGYSLTLTNSALLSEFGTKRQSSVMCWIGSACNDLTNPFVAFDGEEEIPYAEKSNVLIFGRIGIKRLDGEDLPQLKVMGVFTEPRRIRRRQGGGDTSEEQFN